MNMNDPKLNIDEVAKEEKRYAKMLIKMCTDEGFLTKDKQAALLMAFAMAMSLFAIRIFGREEAPDSISRVVNAALKRIDTDMKL